MSALHAMQPASDTATIAQTVSGMVTYDHNELIYDARSPLESWFEVVSGSVRARCIGEAGRRRVIEFYLPGDIFGFDDGGAGHGLRTEAAAGRQTVLIRHRRNRLDSRMARDPMLTLRLRGLALYRLAAARNRNATLGLLTAEEKVRAFLTDMKDRLVAEVDLDGRRMFALPVGTNDIVEYLGITPGTLRRSIQSLRRQGAIEMVASGRIKLFGETPFAFSAASRQFSLTTGQDISKAA